MTHTSLGRNRIIANGGLHVGLPRMENSIEAIRRAQDAGLGGVKLDVALVAGRAHLSTSPRFGGENLNGMALAEARHMTNAALPALEEVRAIDWDMTIVLELHQSGLVDVAADLLSDLPDNYVVASLDHQAVLRCAVEHQCEGMLLVSHRPLPGALHAPPHRLVRTIGWRAWPTWPDDVHAAAVSGWTSMMWNERLPEDAIHIAMSHTQRSIVTLDAGWEEMVGGLD